MEVTKANFEVQMADLLARLPAARFLAIDLEFTGLPKDQSTVADTPMEVYYKATTCANYNNIIQLGVTLFAEGRAPAELEASSFCFYVFPSTHGGRVPQKVSLDVASVEFNRDSGGVDFGKWITEGVPYFNKKLQSQLRRCFDNDRSLELNQAFRERDAADPKPDPDAPKKEFENPVRLADDAERAAALAEAERFRQWAAVYEVGKTFRHSCAKGIFRNHFWNEIRHACGPELANVVVEEKNDESGHHTLFTMASAADKAEHMKRLAADLEERYRKTLGLSAHWEVLTREVSARRLPVVFHQGMLDCMYLYSHFENWCPLNFAEFRKNFSAMFPVVFDTKNLARLVDNDANHLEGLFDWVARRGAFDPALKYPIANRDPTTHAKVAHNAGWDSYMTGVVFSELRGLLGDLTPSQNQISLFKNRFFNLSFGPDKAAFLEPTALVLTSNDKKDGSKTATRGTQRGSKRDRRDDQSRDRLRVDLTTFCGEIGREPRFAIHRQSEQEVIGNNVHLFLSFDTPLTPAETERMAERLRDQFDVRTLQDYHQMVYSNFEQTVYGSKA